MPIIIRQLYSLAIVSYGLLIRLISPFNKKANLWISGRKDFFKKLELSFKKNETIIWFHCASLGEFEQARPLLESLKNQYSGIKILITFFSPSGYEARKNYKEADYIFYLPLDTKQNAEKFIKIVNPKIVFFIKYEFWFHYLNTLNQKKTPTFLVSANFRATQLFFHWYGISFHRILNLFTHIFVQNKTSLELLNSININTATICGDTRFDRVYTISQEVKKIPLLDAFKQNCKLFIVGSSWPFDEELLIKLINEKTFPENFKIIIVPHEPREKDIQKILKHCQVKTLRFSNANEKNIADSKVLIIDSIGLLSSLYQYADIAYVGGGFGKGIHNILEPATFGMPIVFGPNYKKFAEAMDLVKLGGAFSISSYKELKDNISFLLSDDMVIKIASEISGNYVRMNKGATEKITRTLNLQNIN